MKKITIFFVVFLLHSLASSAQENYADCQDAIILCEKKDILITSLKDAGIDKFEAQLISCCEQLVETNSAWVKWEIATAGDLTFTLLSLDPSDDVDFVLYKLDSDDINDCAQRKEIRCMAAGLTIGRPIEDNFACSGSTGLSKGVKDIAERQGCTEDQDNYVAALAVEKGDKFLLFINNFSGSNGVKLVFGGSATFGLSDSYVGELDGTAQVSTTILALSEPDLGSPDLKLTKVDIRPHSGSKFYQAQVGCRTAQEEAEQEETEQEKRNIGIGPIFPNPAEYATTLKLKVPTDAIGNVAIYNILGVELFRRDYVLVQGINMIPLDISQYPSGPLAVRTEIKGYSQTLLVVKAWQE